MDQRFAQVKFAQITPEVLEQFLATATRRIVIAKAGYSVSEVNQLIRLVQGNEISCALYMEAGENPIRYGFGQAEALPLIEEHMDILNVQSVNQIRMALVIVDDAALVYAPVALSWEKPPAELEFPNGVFGNKGFAETLFEQMGGKIVEVVLDPQEADDGTEKQAPIVIPVPPIPKKKAEEIKTEIEEASKGLKANPPPDPATLRNTTFYRNKYKLLKTTVHGARVSTKSLDLRPFNRIFPQADSRLRSSWSPLTATDAKKLPSQQFLTTVEKEIEKCTFNAGRHGKLIERQNMDNLEKKINNLAKKLQKQLQGEHPVRQQTNITGESSLNLKTILQDSHQSLVSYLLPLAVQHDTCLDKLFAHERSLFRQMKKGEIEKEKAIRQALETFVEDILHFPTPENIIESIKVEYDYYDVSDELLADPDFLDRLKEFDVEVREYSDGFEKNQEFYR